MARLSLLTEDGPVDHDGVLLLPLLVNEVQVESEADNFLNRQIHTQNIDFSQKIKKNGAGIPVLDVERLNAELLKRQKTERRKDGTSK